MKIVKEFLIMKIDRLNSTKNSLLKDLKKSETQMKQIDVEESEKNAEEIMRNEKIIVLEKKKRELQNSIRENDALILNIEKQTQKFLSLQNEFN